MAQASLKKQTLRFELLEQRHMLTGVVINEIHYDPDVSSERVEFIEFYNSSASVVDLSGWQIDKAVDYTFPASSSLGPNEYLVVAQDATDFQSKFGFSPFDVWEEGDQLSNSGEKIELLDAAETIVDKVSYQLGFPWPTVGEYGSSIELTNPEFDNNVGGAWRSATSITPLVVAGSEWAYRKGVLNNPPTDWNQIGFDDTTDNVAWQTGLAGIGYGDGDDATELSDMRGNYSSVYLRQEFQLNGVVPNTLTLQLYVDDGAIVYINGQEVTRAHVTGGSKNYDSTSGADHEAEWEAIELTGLASVLVEGTNLLAVHGLNSSFGSSDFSIDAELAAIATLTSPGTQNSAFVANSAPFLDDVQHSISQPQSGQEVVITAEVTDTQGVGSVAVEYQLVEPGDYIAIDDPRYLSNWTSLPMTDDGTGGDAVNGDGVYSATLPGALQVHRQLVRYRITAFDTLGASVTGPYSDDPQPNFAYYVYDQTPDWEGAIEPGTTDTVTYSGELLDSVSTYHLITTSADHEDSQYIDDSSLNSGYAGNEYLWDGALVYDGVVYDHIRYRARGGVWRYAMGKNMWKLEFNRGHLFYASDDYGNQYDVGWKKLNLGAVIQQGDFWHRGEQGLFESAGFKLFNLAGVESPNTNYVQFRIVESADENGADQYSGDFQGLYLAVEQLDGQFLDQHDLPDGNLYKMENGTGVSGIGGELKNNGDYPEPTDSSDLINFKTTYENSTQTAAWWEENFNLESYYSYRSIVEGIHHYDIGYGKNYYYYHNPETDKWETLPWDLDLTWANNMYGNGNEPFHSRVLNIPEFAQDYRNRMREIRDLLYNTDQAGAVIDEIASFIYTPGETSLVDADRAMWDYNPIMTSGYVNSSKSGEGRFYAGGGGVPATNDFAGMIQLLKDYVASRGAWIDSTILTTENQVPATPTISYTGSAGFSIDELYFTTSSFSDPNGDGFAAMEWRLGEVANPNTPGFDTDQPWKYEITADWESGELLTYDSTIKIAGTAAVPGQTYRARVRMQDDDGNWSHWSEPVEFVAGEGEVPDLSITELHYHPNNPELADEDDQEFIEIFNFGSTTIDLAGIQIADFASTPYTFDNGLSLEPGEYFVIARTPSVFTSIYGSDMNMAPTGFANRSLSNGGETVTLLTASGMVIQSFEYDDKTPWPEAADGEGSSLEIIDPQGDHDDAANWRASTTDGGSPGWEGSAPSSQSGDYDGDRDVDGNDFLTWQRAFNNTASPAYSGADGNGDGTVNGDDLSVWNENFAGGSASVSTLTVAALTTTPVPLLSNNSVTGIAAEDHPEANFPLYAIDKLFGSHSPSSLSYRTVAIVEELPCIHVESRVTNDSTFAGNLPSERESKYLPSSSHSAKGQRSFDEAKQLEAELQKIFIEE